MGPEILMQGQSAHGRHAVGFGVFRDCGIDARICKMAAF